MHSVKKYFGHILVTLACFTPFLVQASTIDVGQVISNIVVNKSAQYLSASMDSGIHSLAAIHPKILGQPDTGVGYGEEIVSGGYSVTLKFQLPTPIKFLKLKIQTANGVDAVVNLLDSNRAYFPETWYQITVPIDVVATDTDRLRFSILVQPTQSTGVVTVNIDDINVANEEGASILKGDLSFDKVPFSTVDNPAKALIVGSNRFESFAVKKNLRWQQLSAWYEENRVQQHSRYSPSDYTIPYSEYLTKSDDLAEPESKYRHWYWHGAKYASSIGARVWGRHVKSRLEGPHWLTETPQIDGAISDSFVWQELLQFDDTDRNPIDDFLQLSKENNLETIAYYRMIGDTPLAQFSPYDTWFALRPNGLPVPINGDPENPLFVPGSRMSMFSPYPMDIVKPRISELAEKGFAGAYFDSSHGVSNGDWSSWAAQAMTDRYSSPLPSERDLGLLSYRRLLGLHTIRLEDVFTEMQTDVHARYPDFTFIVGSFRYADLVSLNSSVDLVSLLQVPKTERKLGHRLFDQFLDREVEGRVPLSDYPNEDLGNEFALALTRDTVNGRPPHVWVHNPAELDKFDENGDDLLAWELDISTHQLLAASSSVLTLGGVANVDIYDDYDEGLLPMPASHAAPVFSMGKSAESFLSYSRPLKTVCIHANEHARNTLFDESMTQANSVDVLEQHWRNLIAPVIFAYETIKDEGVPVGFITDPQLSAHEFGDCRALVLPSSDLTESQASAVDLFSMNGGAVTFLDQFDWSRLQLRLLAAEALRSELQGTVASSLVKVEYDLKDGRSNGFFVRHEEDQTDTIIVALSGDISWLSDTALSAQQKKDFVPSDITPSTVTLRGIEVEDIESMHSLRYANVHKSWVTKRISHQNLLADVGEVHLRLDKDSAGSSKHLRLLRIKLNRKIP